ncbi:MAG: gliding motility protein GldC [Pseudomonadota bacterium]
MKKSEIKISVSLDEKNIPVKIDWQASDNDAQDTSNAVFLSLWDQHKKNSLRIDLWTKEMSVEEMKQFYYQNLLSMADTLERATGETEAAGAMRNFAHDFGQRMRLIMENPVHSMLKK